MTRVPQGIAEIDPEYIHQLKERFWRSVDKSGDCWIFTGLVMAGKGYGRVSVQINKKQKMFSAHRLSYELHYGPLPDLSLFVCHHCDNPPCVNPNHLFLGTCADNLSDMWAKGRSGIQRGNKPNTKLSAADVTDIRARLASGEMQKSIAASYGVQPRAIGDIKNGFTWSDIQ